MSKHLTRDIMTRCRGLNSLRPLPDCTLRRGRNELKPLQLTYPHYFATSCWCVLLICFLISLSACSANTSSATTQPQPTASPTQQLSPTPTNPPAGIVLFQADWSHGLPSWQNMQGWKVVQGKLETEGGPATFTLPYTPKVSNYAVEIRIQIVHLINKNGGYFSLSAPQQPGKNGYDTGISDLQGTQPRPNGAHPSAQVNLRPVFAATQGTGIPIDYEPHLVEHSYRVEVQDNQVSLFSDDVSLVEVSSNQADTLSNGPITFKSDLVILRISSLRIVTA